MKRENRRANSKENERCMLKVRLFSLPSKYRPTADGFFNPSCVVFAVLVVFWGCRFAKFAKFVANGFYLDAFTLAGCSRYAWIFPVGFATIGARRLSNSETHRHGIPQ
jgi:hypothetical protein